MQTVILAAGRGTRMRPLTDTIPKPMLPVGDRPLVAHVADAAVAAGATRLVFVVGYEAGTVREYFGTTYKDTPVAYAKQDEQRGTADAVLSARSMLEDAPFVVLNGDVLVEADALEALYAAAPAVGATQVDEPEQYGILELTDDETVRDVIEKPANPPSSLANAGAYAFPAEALSYLGGVEASERGEYELTDVLSHVCREGKVSLVRFDRWLDVGRPWELLAATEWKLEGLEPAISGDVSDQATTIGPVVVEEGATVRNGVTLEGPVLVKSGARIGPNAYVRGSSVIGENARVGHAVEVKNSVLFAGATVGHQSYVGDSLLGPEVNFGAGTNVANLRHDGNPVRTTVKDEQVSTGRRKYGVVVGPEVKTGIDTSLNAGVVLPSQSYTLPGEVLLSGEDAHRN